MVSVSCFDFGSFCLQRVFVKIYWIWMLSWERNDNNVSPSKCNKQTWLEKHFGRLRISREMKITWKWYQNLRKIPRKTKNIIWFKAILMRTTIHEVFGWIRWFRQQRCRASWNMTQLSNSPQTLFFIEIQHKSAINLQREHLIKFYSRLIKIYSHLRPRTMF